MEIIADFLMEILPTSVGDWLSRHFFVVLLKKVKSKTLRCLIALLAVILAFGLLLVILLLIIIALMMALN